MCEGGVVVVMLEIGMLLIVVVLFVLVLMKVLIVCWLCIVVWIVMVVNVELFECLKFGVIECVIGWLLELE